MNSGRFIPVAAPALVGNEKKYVVDCLESNWISSTGAYIERFEQAFANFCGGKYAVSCCNGTAALHLALLALGVGPEDEIIAPTLTFVATANAIKYCGARPIFLDSELETWNLDPSLIEEQITERTKGIIVVHLFGHPVDMDPVISIARKYGLFVVEDAAEAHGAEYKGRRVGSLGDISTFSFYGNKIITTGEGGIVVTNSKCLAEKVYQLKGQGICLDRRYWFPVIGYNYRMTNIAAAIGLAQMEKIDWHIERRREIANQYAQSLREFSGIRFQPELPWARNCYWMTSIILDENEISISRDYLMKKLAESGIETRPFFHPMHTLPMFRDVIAGKRFPKADYLAKRGINLPSFATLTKSKVSYICDQIIRILSCPKIKMTRMPCAGMSELRADPHGRKDWPWIEESKPLPKVMPGGQLWPRISIITPSLDQGGFLEETIRSVLLQGYPNLEYIVIDGGSTDNSFEVIKKYEPWLTYWVSESDRGQSHAINKGLLKATGDFVAYQNSDDIYWPEALRSVGELLRHGDIDIMFGTVDILDECGNRRPPVCPIPEPQIDVLIRFWKGPSNILPSQGFFCRLDLLKKIGLFNEKYHYKMDLDVICRLLEIVPRQRIARIDDILAGYRIYETSKTGNMSSHKAVEEGIEISSRYWEQVSGGYPEKIAREARRGKGFMAFCRASIAAEKGSLGTTLKELIHAYACYPRLGITHSSLNMLKKLCLSNWVGR